jgi:hypothetical protein
MSETNKQQAQPCRHNGQKLQSSGKADPRMDTMRVGLLDASLDDIQKHIRSVMCI